MTQFTRKRVILFKSEVTYGVDPTPTGAANAILVRNLDIKPVDGNEVSRDLVRAYMGASDRYVDGASVVVTFEVEMQGSGAAGTAPAYGPLLKACAMSETVVASTTATYAPLSSAFGSGTIYYNVDGVLHKVNGCRGNVEVSMQSGQIPFFKFTFTGLYNSPTDTAIPAPTYTPFKEPLVFNSDNAVLTSVFGAVIPLDSIQMNFGHNVIYRKLIGAEDIQLTDRSVSGTVVIEAPAIATFNAFDSSIGTGTFALNITQGTVAGYKVQITCPKCSLQSPTYQDKDGVQMLSIPFVAVPSTAGNDEISIVVK